MHDDRNDHERDGGIDAGRLGFEETYRPLFASDIAGARVAAPAFLFTPILRSRTLTMLSAEPFTGKTLLMLSMLLSLDTGTSLLGQFPPASGHRCLFIGQDAPTWDYHGQFLKLFYGLGLGPSEADTSLPSFFFLNRGFSLLDPDFFKMLEEAVLLYGTSVLFLDTLLEFHNLDENSNRDMKRVMGILKAARDHLGLTILFSHHTNKLFMTAGAFPARSPANPLSGNALPISRNAAARGASVIAGSVDAHVALRGAGTDEQNSPLVELSFPKGRGLDNAAPIVFSISPLLRSDKTPALVLRQPADISSALCAFVSIAPQSRSNISRHLVDRGFTFSNSGLSRLLSSLEERNLIRSTAHGVWERGENAQ